MNPPTPIVMDPHGADIQGQNAEIRATGPVALVQLPDGITAWAITDAALLKKVLSGTFVTKSARKHWPAFQRGEIPANWSLMVWIAVDNMFTAAGDDHTRLRRLVAPTFSPRRIKLLSARIAAITTELLDALAATPAGAEVDLREALAYPLPIRVIGELLGVPEDLNDRLRACVDVVFDSAATEEETAASTATMYQLLAELADYRRYHPGEDLTSDLVGDPDNGLTERQILDTLLLMINAGHETTVNLIVQAIYQLQTRPELRAAVLSSAVSWPQIIGETLRFESPVAHLPLRFAVEDVTLGGVDIKAGDPILASYAAASRDPKVHGDTADMFDPHRSTLSEHLAFGYGTHYCLGAPLARLEAETVLSELYRRFPDLELTVTDPAELGSVPGFIANAPARLPARLKG